jgi:hypothetical protein
MANSITVKPKLTVVFWMAIILCLLPFLLLSLFNVLSADDYLLYTFYRSAGFLRTQQNLYLTWSGRYTSTFLSGSYVSLDILRSYPFLHVLLFFLFTWCGIFFLLSAIRSLLPGRPYTRTRVIQASFVLFVLLLYVQAEIATGYYWFSSAVVYQSAFILFLLFLGLLAKRVFMAKRSLDVWVILLILLIAGCNELITVFLICFLGMLIAASYYYRRSVPNYLLVYLSVSVVTGLIITFTSGVITVRHRMMNPDTSYITVMPVIFFHSAATLYYILKEPLFWVMGTVLFFAGAHSKEDRLPVFFGGKPVFLPGLSAIVISIILTLTPVLLTTRGSLPPRALNNLTDLVTCCLLGLIFLAGINKGAAGLSLPGLAPALPVIILAAALMASVNYWEAWKSVFSGYFYHAVMADRDRQLSTSRNDTILPYDAAVREKLRQTFPHGVPGTVEALLLERPSDLYYNDGAELQDPAYLKFYGVDSIVLKKR